jgi:hypothetical protein
LFSRKILGAATFEFCNTITLNADICLRCNICRNGPIATETGTPIIWSDANRQHATATKFLPVQYEINGR